MCRMISFGYPSGAAIVASQPSSKRPPYRVRVNATLLRRWSAGCYLATPDGQVACSWPSLWITAAATNPYRLPKAADCRWRLFSAESWCREDCVCPSAYSRSPRHLAHPAALGSRSCSSTDKSSRKCYRRDEAGSRMCVRSGSSIIDGRAQWNRARRFRIPR